MRAAVALLLFVPALAARAQNAEMPVAGARDLAYASDGRLALSVRGDLWIVSTDGKWTHLTSGADWDRQPAWSADGKSLFFSSNRGGNFDIWQITMGDTGATAAPTRVVGGGDDEAEPAVAADGRLLFVRGRGAAARILVRERDGTEHRLTSSRA